MTTPARRTKRKGSVPEKGRHRSQSSPDPWASAGSCRPNQEARLPFVPHIREPSVTPQESQLSDQRAPKEDPSAGQETSLKAWLYFLWRVSKDKESQAGFFRLACIATIPLAFVVAIYLTMPAPAPLKAIFTGGGVTLIAVGTSVLRWLKKRRPRQLTAVRLTPGPADPIAAAQEADGWPGEQYRDGREQGSYTGPHQDAHPARQRRRGPRTSRRRRDSGFRPVGDQSQPATATFCLINRPGSVWRDQGDPGLLVSAHLVCPITPAGPGMRRLRDSANVPSPGGADLSRPSANIMCPAVTYCRHEVA
jgi:hypothetical protein